MNFAKFISFCSSLNLVLTIAGYSFITTFLLPFNASAGMSQVVTIPYRILVLLLSLTIIFSLIRKKTKINYWTKVLIFFWILYLIRIVFDLSFRFDNFFTTESKILYYSYVFFISFIPFISLVMSYRYIRFDQVLKFSVLLLTISMIACLFNNSMLEENSRLTGNVALNPISYGEVGAKAVILAGFLFSKNRKIFMKILFFGVIILGFITLGRAASRGPLLGLFVAIFFYVIAAQKQPITTILMLLLSCAFIVIFQDYIIDFIGLLSPTLKLRVEASLYENDSSDRGPLFIDGINQFLNYPVFGNYFVLYPETGKGINTHNILIDVFMSLGIFGGLLFIVLMMKGIFSSFKMIKRHSSINWIACFYILSTITSMVTTSFYMDSLFSVILFLTFAATSKLKLN